MDSLVLKGVKIKVAALTPPLSNPHPLERLQKTFWFLVTWVNWIMARIMCPPTVCPQLVLVGKRNDGNIFLRYSYFQCLCGPSIRVWFLDFRMDSILIAICMRVGNLMVFLILSESEWQFDMKVQFRGRMIFEFLIINWSDKLSSYLVSVQIIKMAPPLSIHKLIYMKLELSLFTIVKEITGSCWCTFWIVKKTAKEYSRCFTIIFLLRITWLFEVCY